MIYNQLKFVSCWYLCTIENNMHIQYTRTPGHLVQDKKRVNLKKIVKTVHYACLLYKYYINRIRIQFVFPDQDPQDYHLL